MKNRAKSAVFFALEVGKRPELETLNKLFFIWINDKLRGSKFSEMTIFRN